MSILAATDGTVDEAGVLETAYDLATTYESTLHVLHVVSQDEFESRKEIVERVGGIEKYGKPQRADAAANVARAVVESTFDDVDYDTISTMGRVGDPTAMIRETAIDVDARFVVVGGRERSPAGKAIFGSTTQSVLLQVDRPVVTVFEDAE